MNERQNKICEILINEFYKNNGQLYYSWCQDLITKNGYSKSELDIAFNILIEDLKFLRKIPNDNRFVLTSEGFDAGKFGFRQYILKIENVKNLNQLNNIENIKGIRSTKILSIIALIVAIVIPTIQIILDQNSNSSTKEIKKNNNIADSAIVNNADSIIIDKIKYSIYNDSVFLRKIKELIDKKETK